MQIREVVSVIRGLRETIEKMRDFILKQAALHDEMDNILASSKVFAVGRGEDVTIRCASKSDRKRLLMLLGRRT